MEAQKNLIKNIALFLFIGAIPSIGWASGYFSAFSWATLFLLSGGCFCILWLKERQNTQALKSILATRDDAWAICEGDRIIERSPFFPCESLGSLKQFFHPDVYLEVECSINSLINKNKPFKIKIHAAKGNAIYTFEGEPSKGNVIFWLRNITEAVYLERQNAENLEATEKLLNKLQVTLDTLPIPIWQRDHDQRITYCNQAYAQAIGAPSQVVLREGLELIQPRSAKILARKSINMNEPQFSEDIVASEETDRHYRVCEIPHGIEDGTLGIAYNITALKQADQEIKHLIEAHTEVLSHLSIAIAIYDASGTLQYYNQAYVNLYNFDQSFLKAHPRLDEILEDLRGRRQIPEYVDFPSYKRTCLQLLTEQTQPIEDMMHLPDERTIRNFSAPHPRGGLLFLYEDVTNYLSLERNNKTLLNSYKVTLDNLFEPVIIIGSNNCLENFNPNFLRLWNFTKEDLNIGQHLNQIVEQFQDFLDYAEDWEIYKAKFMESVTDRTPKTGLLKRKDGGILNFSYVPLPNGSHLISYADATASCRVQQVLHEKNEVLETVSSELSAPLNTIIGLTETLCNGELNEKQTGDDIMEPSGKLLHLVNNKIYE